MEIDDKSQDVIEHCNVPLFQNSTRTVIRTDITGLFLTRIHVCMSYRAEIEPRTLGL